MLGGVFHAVMVARYAANMTGGVVDMWEDHIFMHKSGQGYLSVDGSTFDP